MSNTNKTIIFEEQFVDKTTEGGKIALKCREKLSCIRAHLGYTHYRINDRSQCPTTCCLNKLFSEKELRDVHNIDDWNKTFEC